MIAYTLELKYYFCRSATRSVSEECDAWRKRALELQAELEATRAAATLEGAGTTKLTPSASKRKKKQTKKPPQTSEVKRSQVLDIASTATARDTVEPPGSSLWTKSSLFSSLRALDDISARISAKPAPQPEAALLVAATFRCLEVFHALIARAVSPASCAPEDPTPREALECIERTLPDILRTAVPCLHGAYIHPSSVAGPRWHAADSGDDEPTHHPCDTASALDLVLGRVTTDVLLPAIRALVPCALAKTEHVLAGVAGPETRPKKDFADGALLLNLVGAVLDALPDPSYITLYDRVALEAVRALTTLIVDRSSRVLPRTQQTATQRIHRIARKDALHFLCDFALLAFRRSASAPAPRGSPEEMLRAALADALGDLALTQSVREGGSGSGLDIVEEQYVMAVLERAWSVGLRVGHICGESDGAKMDVGRHDVHEQDEDVTMMDAVRAHEAREEDPPWVIF